MKISFRTPLIFSALLLRRSPDLWNETEPEPWWGVPGQKSTGDARELGEPTWPKRDSECSLPNKVSEPRTQISPHNSSDFTFHETGVCTNLCTQTNISWPIENESDNPLPRQTPSLTRKRLSSWGKRDDEASTGCRGWEKLTPGRSVSCVGVRAVAEDDTRWIPFRRVWWSPPTLLPFRCPAVM